MRNYAGIGPKTRDRERERENVIYIRLTFCSSKAMPCEAVDQSPPHSWSYKSKKRVSVSMRALPYSRHNHQRSLAEPGLHWPGLPRGSKRKREEQIKESKNMRARANS